MIFLRTKWPKFVQFNIFLNASLLKSCENKHIMLVKNTPVHCIYYTWNVLRLTLHRPIKSLATASKSSSPQTLSWTWRTAIWLSRSCVMVDLRYVFSLRRVENDRSAVLADHVLILSTLFYWNLTYGPNSSGCNAPTGVFLWVHSHPTLPRSRRLCLAKFCSNLWNVIVVINRK